MAGNSLGELRVALGIDAAEFTRGLSRADAEAKRFADNVRQVGEQAGRLLAGGAIAAATGIGFLTKQAIDSADHLLDLSKATSLTVETLGGIGFAASQAGSDLDSAAQAIGKLSIKIAEAAAGGKEEAALFKALGISVKDAAGETVKADVIFGDLATRFATYADGPEKAALGNAIFGKSYQQVLPLLADGGEALRDNIAYFERYSGVTTDVAKQADEFNDTLGKLGLLSKSFGNTLASELLPSLQAVASEILRLKEESTAFQTVAAGVRVIFETIAVVGANVAFVFGAVGREIGAVAAQIAALGRGDLAGFRAISDAVKADGVRARAELDALEQRILGLTAKGTGDFARLDRIGVGGGRGKAPRIPGGGGKAQVAQLSEAERYLEALDKQYLRTLDLTTAEQALIDVRAGMGGLTTEIEKEIIARAKQIDQSAEFEMAKKAEQEARLSAINAAVAENAQLLVGNQTLQLEIDLLGKDAVARAAHLNALDETIIKTKENDLAMREFLVGQDWSIDKLKEEIGLLKEKQRLRTIKADVERFQDVVGDAEKRFLEAQKVQNTLAQSIEQGILDGFRRGGSLAEIFLNELKAQFAKTILRPIIAPIAEGGNQLIALLLQGVMNSFGGGGGGTTGDFSRMDRGQGLNGESALSASRSTPLRPQGGTTVNNYVQGGVQRNEVLQLLNMAMESMERQTETRLRRAGVA